MLIHLNDDHVLLAEQLFGYSFALPEQKAAFQLMRTGDVQAAPGSGKTSLLAAKISVLLREWAMPYRGMCILAHTNTAVREIKNHAERVGAFLGSPHFVGTVQSFAHRFLAMPCLRSMGVADVKVDDDEYEARILQLLRWGQFSNLRGWLENKRCLNVVKDVRYQGPNLRLKMPFVLGEASKSYQELSKLKEMLRGDGVFRYDEMFAFALAYLQSHPSCCRLLSHRFPLVFIDEAQDLDEDQLEFLEASFEPGVVVQRFGDVNQAIFSSRRGHEGSAQRCFPRPDALSLPRSHRFGRSIAVLANKLRQVGPEIVGSASRMSSAPRVIVFTPETISLVLPRFAELLLEQRRGEFPPSYIAKAIGARRHGQAVKAESIPRDIYDYCRGFCEAPLGEGRSDFCAQMRSAFLAARKVSIREGIRVGSQACRNYLDILSACPGCSKAALIRMMRELNFQAHTGRSPFRQTLARILSMPCFPASERWPFIVTDIFSLFAGKERSSVLAACIDGAPYSESGGAGGQTDELVYVHGSSGLKIGVDTIHNSKGETHDATLLLETYIAQSHDLKLTLSRLTETPDENLLQRRRRAFVALTRPRDISCLALPEQFVSRKVKRLLEADMGCVLVPLSPTWGLSP